MTRRQKIWLVVASLFTLVNVAGAVYAGMMAEVLHSALHVGLALVGAAWVWGIARRVRKQSRPAALQPDDRLAYLQQSVDAIAIEVERIGEAQRFNAKLAAQREEAPAPQKPESTAPKRNADE